ncbi:MAG: hypothetical protein KBD83_07435 [Gammaproteobacteria bacterium]|nr:hypothetical protein [Gammaproteobacteria bacterium]
MANTIKVLGQSKPSATTLTAAYTVPAATSATVSSFTVCNQSATATSFRMSVAPAGAADATSQYIYYDVAIAGNDTFIATVGITMEAASIIRVYNTLATLSFSIFGVETT